MMQVLDPVGAPWGIDCCGKRPGAGREVVDVVGRAGEAIVRIACESLLAYALTGWPFTRSVSLCNYRQCFLIIYTVSALD